MIIHTRHQSRFLEMNMLGDPAERDLFVYLPPGYEGSGHQLRHRLLAACLRPDRPRGGVPTDGRREVGATGRGRLGPGIRPDGRAANDRGHTRRQFALGVRTVGGLTG
jgi:hypothetical protein